MEEQKRGTIGLMIIFLVCLAVLAGAALMNWMTLEKPHFYLNLRAYPIYGREGFVPDLTPQPGAEQEAPWIEISPAGDNKLVLVKDKFDVPRLTFLSPFS